MTQAASNQAAASEHRAHPSSRPMGKPVTIDINGRTAAAYVSVHNSGSGPGLLLIGDSSKLDAGLKARADLFAEEGYSVLLIGNDHSTADVAAAADAARALETTDGGLACVGFGSGAWFLVVWAGTNTLVGASKCRSRPSVSGANTGGGRCPVNISGCVM